MTTPQPGAARAMPRHAGSRVVDKPPNILRTIRLIEKKLARLASVTRPEVLVAVPASPSRWEPAAAASMTNVLRWYVYRSGSKILADVGCGTGAGSVMRAQLAVPALGLTGDAVTTASGGTERIVRLSLTMPEAWASGAVYPVYVQAMRVSGTDATTLAVLRGWQR